MLNTLKSINSCSGVSGREHNVQNKILTYIAPLTDKVWEDAMGNLIAVKYGSGENKKKIMLCAHADEIGFIVTHIDDRGFIRTSPIGGINFVAASFGYVVSESGVKGVMVPEAGTKAGDIAADKVYIDIGAKDKKEAEKKVQIGDTFHLESNVTRIGKKICGRPMDDRIGCVALIEIARKMSEGGCKNDIYFCFSVQEEVGVRGSKTAAFGIEPDYAIVYDVTGTGDVPGAKPMACSVGGGAAIKIKDSSVICDRETTQKLMALAKENDIKYQWEILTYGGTDTSSIQMSRAGCKAVALSIPTRYIHTGVEMIDMNDVSACVDLTLAFDAAIEA